MSQPTNPSAGPGDRAPGTTTIAPGVLVAISQLTALAVEGVSGLAAVPGGVNRMIRRTVDEGVEVSIQDGSVSIRMHLILEDGVNVREVGRNVQHEITRAIGEMVGMDVERVDVNVRDISFGEAAAPSDS